MNCAASFPVLHPFGVDHGISMKTLRVPTLKPGRYWCQDVSGRWDWKEYTSADARQMVANGNGQIKSGLSTPLCWMHDPRAKPQNLSHTPVAPGKPSYTDRNKDEWMAKGFFGDIVGWEFDPQTEEAVAIVTVEDEDDAKQFMRVKRVSPGVRTDYVDQRGVRWPGVTCMHIASTPKPIQIGLSPVTEVPQAFRSQYLSHQADGGNTVWLSHDSNIKVSPMAKDDETNTVTPADLTEMVELLKQDGYHIHGDPQTFRELLGQVKTALATKKGGLDDDKTSKAGKKDGDMDGDMKEEGDHTAAGGTPYFLSVDPRTQSILSREAAIEFKDYEARILKLAADAKIDQARKNEMLAEIRQVDLSVGASALSPFFVGKDLKFKAPPIALEIAAYEKLQPGRLGKENIGKANTDSVDLSHRPIALPAEKPADKEEFDELDKVRMSKLGISPDQYREHKRNAWR
jgi:hypothetical protein